MRQLSRLLAAGALAFELTGQAGAQIRLDPSSGATGSLSVMSYRDIPFRTVVRQQYDFSCGSAALATLLTYQYGLPTTEADAFKAMFATGDQARIRQVGFSMLDMKRYLASRGLDSDGFRVTLDDVAKSGAPVIVLIDLGRYRHFVVVKGVFDGQVLVGDPAQGLKTYSAAEFNKLWNGVAFVMRSSARLRPVFNAASEWRPWSVAPLEAAAAPIAPAELSRNLAPAYQITPVLVLPASGPGTLP